ncbi:MAG: 4a-hydroxytetrahydrobiopterin dehydratase [Nitrososphaeraceae archaeon]
MNHEIEKSIAEELVEGWELKEGKLVKLFQFSSFMNAIDFVNEIAKIAERFNHHPIITANSLNHLILMLLPKEILLLQRK